MRCTMIYTFKNTSEHVSGSRHHCALSRTVHLHMTSHSRTVSVNKQRALMCRNGWISYGGVHFNVDRCIVGGDGALFLCRRFRHNETNLR